jgi:hypothetical protein
MIAITVRGAGADDQDDDKRDHDGGVGSGAREPAAGWRYSRICSNS